MWTSALALLLCAVALTYGLWCLLSIFLAGWRHLRHGSPPIGVPHACADGFGQGADDDARFARRFRQCRRQAVTWRRPTEQEAARWDTHPIASRFGMATDAVADVDGRQWILRSRMWHGWPDPPQFAFFAFADDAVWAAADFDWIPRCWTLPGDAS